MNSKTHKKALIIVLFIVSMISICLYINPLATGLDENYTLALINHSYLNIIRLDSMDVHPFLYYFIVKLFIQITTFWTSYLPIKIISARILSILLFIGTFVVLIKIINVLKIRNNIYFDWLLFLILPEILGSGDSQLDIIRMYALASFFISLEFLNLLKFDITNKFKYLICGIIFAILAMYTHYYASMFSGLLLFVYCIKNYVIHQYHKAFMLMISCFVLIMMFIPWMFIFYKQICNPNTYWMNSHDVIIEFGKFIILLLLFTYPWIKYIKQHGYNEVFLQFIVLLSVIIPTFIFSILYSLIKGSMFQVRYMMPVFLIYEFIGITICVKCLYTTSYIKEKLILSVFVLILSISTITNLRKQVSIEYQAINTVRKYQLNTNKEVNVHISPTSANNITSSSGILTTIILNHEVISIPKSSEKKFKNNITIYSNPTYRYLFRNEINRIKFKS